MHRRAISWICLPLAVSSFLFLTPQKLPRSKDPSVMLRELDSGSSPLRSIDPSETDFSDFSGVEHSIQNKRIVALGEATHADAATYRAKVRFVEFLHERLGFDVLIWEAGILDANCLNLDLQINAIDLGDAAKCLMDDTWASSKAVSPLFQYARNTWKTARPLQMAGMAGAHPPRGIRNFLDLIGSIEVRLPVIGGSLTERERLRQLASRILGENGAQNASVSTAERQRQRQALQLLFHRLVTHETEVEKTLGSREAAFVEHSVQAILDDETAKYDYAKYLATGSDIWLERSGRDREAMMGRNVLWFANTYFPEKKIIIWAATAHLLRTSQQIEPAIESKPATDRYASAGDYISQKLPQDYFVIAFTTGAGSMGVLDDCNEESETRPFNLPQMPPLSYESLAATLDHGILFTNMRGSPKTSWLWSAFVAAPVGFVPQERIWRLSVDAFLYLQHAEPDHTVCSH